MIASALSSAGCLGIVRTVTNISRSVDFYRRLGFTQPGGEQSPLIASLRFGAMTLTLQRAKAECRLLPIDTRSNDEGFRHIAVVVANMPEAFNRISQHDIDLISTSPQTLPSWNAASGGIQAVYFRDPDRHPIELIHFPAGRGKRLWHETQDGLFLGVDHTAIVVADTAVSLAFYCGRLGFKVVATAHNYGPEQENLSGIFGASVLVTTLAAADEAFTLELLEYLNPKRQEAAYTDRFPGDLLWSETTVAAAPPLKPGSAFCDPDGYGVTIR